MLPTGGQRSYPFRKQGVAVGGLLGVVQGHFRGAVPRRAIDSAIVARRTRPPFPHGGASRGTAASHGPQRHGRGASGAELALGDPLAVGVGEQGRRHRVRCGRPSARSVPRGHAGHRYYAGGRLRLRRRDLGHTAPTGHALDTLTVDPSVATSARSRATTSPNRSPHHAASNTAAARSSGIFLQGHRPRGLDMHHRPGTADFGRVRHLARGHRQQSFGHRSGEHRTDHLVSACPGRRRARVELPGTTRGRQRPLHR